MAESLVEYCQRLRQHIAATEKDPATANVSRRAVDAYERSQSQGVLSDEALADIMRAAKSRRRGPFYIGIELMAALYGQFPDVEIAWRQLSVSRDGHERWVAITALYPDRIPNSFAEELIRAALTDRSAKVRMFAAERIYTRKLRSLLPNLKETLPNERNEKVANHRQWVLDMLERGHHHRPAAAEGQNPSIDVQIGDDQYFAATMPIANAGRRRSRPKGA